MGVLGKSGQAASGEVLAYAVVALLVLAFVSFFGPGQTGAQSPLSNGVNPAATSTASSPFNFTMNLMENVMNVQPGGRVNQNFSITYTGSNPSPVSFMANGSPPGVSITFNPNECTPFCITTMTVTASQGEGQGSYQVTVTGNGGGVTHNAHFTLNVGQVSTSTITTQTGSSMTGPTSQPWFSVSCQSSSLSLGSSTTCTARVNATSSSAPTATGVVSWAAPGPGGMSPTGFSPPQCTLSDDMCTVSFTPTSAGSYVKVVATYQGDSHYPPAMAAFVLNVFSSTGTLTTVTVISGSITSTFTSPVTSGTHTTGTSTTTSTSGPTLPSLPSLSITPLVPLVVMVALIAVSAAMAVNWLRVERRTPAKPPQADGGTGGQSRQEGSS